MTIIMLESVVHVNPSTYEKSLALRSKEVSAVVKLSQEKHGRLHITGGFFV